MSHGMLFFAKEIENQHQLRELTLLVQFSSAKLGRLLTLVAVCCGV